MNNPNPTQKKFKIKIKYRNSNTPLVFMSTETSIKNCFSRVNDILCDEIYFIKIKQI